MSPDAPPVALALSTLPALLNTQLAQDLTHDISSLLTHSKPAVRKRAVLCLYRVFEKYPEALVDNVGRLRERLLDDDQGEPVQSSTVADPWSLTLTSAAHWRTARRRFGHGQRPDRARRQECGELSALGTDAV
jgi:hypothetical protein